MKPWKALAAGAALVVIGASVAAALAQSRRQPGVYPERPPGLGNDRVFEIQAPWGGSTTARRLGVTLEEMTPADAKERKLPSHSGVRVQAVQPNGPAEKAGVKPGDVVLKVNGEAARSIAQVRRLVNETPIAQKALLTLFRDGKTLDIPVAPEAASPVEELQNRLRQFQREPPRRDFFWGDPTPGPRTPQQEPFVIPRPPTRQFEWPLFEWSPGAARLGVVVQELGPQLAEYFKVKGGVLVASVTSDSPAFRAGIKAGDVVTAVNGKAVGAPAELLRMIRDMKDGEEVALSVVRGGQAQTIKVKLGTARSEWHV